MTPKALEQLQTMPEKIYVTPRGSGTVSGIWVDMKMDDEERGEYEYIRSDISGRQSRTSNPSNAWDVDTVAEIIFRHTGASSGKCITSAHEIITSMAVFGRRSGTLPLTIPTN
jgi:hypothetical protein